jgi:transposase
MAKLIHFEEEQIVRAKKLRDDHNNEREYRAALVFLYIVENKHSAEEAASLFGVGLRTIFEDLDKIRKPETVKKGTWGGGNNHLMTFEEETQFLDEFMEKAKSGLIVTMPELHNHYNLRVGKITPKSTFYRLLKRHDWRKVLPDTRHPKGDVKIQEECGKKTLKWKWQKLQ